MTGFHLKIHVGKKFPESFKIVGGVSDYGLRSEKTVFLERAHIVKERTCKLYCDVFEVIVYRIKCKQLKQTKAKPTGTLLPAALQQALSLITKRKSILAVYLLTVRLRDPGYGRCPSNMSSQEFAVSSRK